MAKIGIMGGTFNPIHNGHLYIARAAYEEYKLDKVHFMPNHIPAYKSKAEMVSASDRMNMVKLAIKPYPDYILDTMEIDRGGKTYTADTLRILHANGDGNQYSFIIGADSLETFTRWYHPQEILSYADLLVAAREDADESLLNRMIHHTEETLQVAGKIHIIRCRNMASKTNTAWIASSQIRKCIALGEEVEPISGQPIRDIIPEAVYDYIKDAHLYTG